MNRKSFTLSTLTACAVLLGAPLAAQAAAAWHQGNGNVVQFTPDHLQSSTSRDQVLAEVNAARADGTLRRMQMSAPLPVKTDVAPKTREQVTNEFLNQSPEALRAQKELFGG